MGHATSFYVKVNSAAGNSGKLMPNSHSAQV